MSETYRQRIARTQNEALQRRTAKGWANLSVAHYQRTLREAIEEISPDELRQLYYGENPA